MDWAIEHVREQLQDELWRAKFWRAKGFPINNDDAIRCLAILLANLGLAAARRALAEEG